MEAISNEDIFKTIEKVEELPDSVAEISDDFDNEVFDDAFDDEESYEFQIFHIVRITKSQVEKLLMKGQVDVEPIEVECIDCSSETIVYPTLVLTE